MAITLSNLSFAYQKNNYLFKQLNLEIPSGFSLLIGPTGCGKSTLLKIIAGLYPKYAGKMSGRVDLHQKTYAMMFQEAGEQFTMTTPREEIVFALENLQLSRKEYDYRLKKAAAFTQISDLLDQTINTLSGGEKQRVALAVLVAMDVDLFLLDEPFASCDPENRRFLINKLAYLCQHGKTILISDHLFDHYEGKCDQVYQIKNQQLIKLNAAEIKTLFTVQKQSFRFKLPNGKETPLFTLNDAAISQGRKLLQQKQLNLYAGKSTLITGANGVGKSSFFKVLTKMLPYSGSIQFKQQEIAKLKPRKYLQQVGQVFQSAEDQFLKITVREEIALSQKRCNSFFTAEKIKESLKQLHLDQHLDQVVYTLSGGQKKKLQILLMLMTKDCVLLFDEPLAGLDHESAKQVISLMRESQEKLSQTFLIISHQVDVLANLCDYHLIFADQQLKYTKEAEQ